MNKKLLAALVVIPVVLFAADKALGLNRPGGDDKRQTSTSTPGGGENQAEAGDAKAPQLLDLQDMDKYELLKLKQQAFLHRTELQSEEGMAAYHESSSTGLWNEALDPALAELVRNKVQAVLQAVDPSDLDLTDAFSRCGSGYSVQLLVDADSNPTGEGYMISDEGCWDRPIAKFEVHLASQVVGVKLAGREGLVPVRPFLLMLKDA